LARKQALDKFRSNEARIILLTTGSGGTGLNLTAASRVFIMDPWWNGAVEEQAWDRVHRIGQTRPVKIVRYVIKGSIEEGIVKVQQKKAALAIGALRKMTPEEMRKAREQDFVSLFEL